MKSFRIAVGSGLLLVLLVVAGCYTNRNAYTPATNPLLGSQGQYLGNLNDSPQTPIGNLSVNRYSPGSTSNPYGAGSRYNPDSINNPYGRYGSRYSPTSARNPYAQDAPKLYDQNGNYRGKLSSNPYDPDSISNPYGRYGSKYSPDSINNPYGAGNPYSPGSPKNPYSTGWKIIGQ